MSRQNSSIGNAINGSGRPEDGDRDGDKGQGSDVFAGNKRETNCRTCPGRSKKEQRASRYVDSNASTNGLPSNAEFGPFSLAFSQEDDQSCLGEINARMGGFLLPFHMSKPPDGQSPQQHPASSMTRDDVLLMYAKAMFSAQVLEGRLRGLATVHRALTAVSRTSGPLPDDEFAAILEGKDFSTLGRLVRQLLAHLSSIGTQFPSITQESLSATVRIRNHLAHGFLAANHLLLDEPEACQLLSQQLEWWGEVFQTWIPLLDRLADQIIGSLGMTADEIGAVENGYAELLTEVRPELLARLRDQVHAISDGD